MHICFFFFSGCAIKISQSVRSEVSFFFWSYQKCSSLPETTNESSWEEVMVLVLYFISSCLLSLLFCHFACGFSLCLVWSSVTSLACHFVSPPCFIFIILVDGSRFLSRTSLCIFSIHASSIIWTLCWKTAPYKLFFLKQLYLLIPGLSEVLHKWSLTLLIIILTPLLEILHRAPDCDRFMSFHFRIMAPQCSLKHSEVRKSFCNQCHQYAFEQWGCEHLERALYFYPSWDVSCVTPWYWDTFLLSIS